MGDERYIIAGPIDNMGGELERLYWSNSLGWVDLSLATEFTLEERQNFSLPVEATGWVGPEERAYISDVIEMIVRLKDENEYLTVRVDQLEYENDHLKAEKEALEMSVDVLESLEKEE